MADHLIDLFDPCFCGIVHHADVVSVESEDLWFD